LIGDGHDADPCDDRAMVAMTIMRLPLPAGKKNAGNGGHARWK